MEFMLGPARFYKAIGLVTSRRRLSVGFFGKVIYRTSEATSAGYSVSKSHIDACICCALASARDCTRDVPRTEMLYGAFLYAVITFFGDEMSSTWRRD